MLAEWRHERILDMVASQGSASVPEIAEALGTSESTVRRDLEKLDHAGRLSKVHGGAVSVESASAASFVTRELAMSEKRDLHAAEKRAIATWAASLIGPDDFVYLDAGTTTAALVEALSEAATHATFATNSVSNALALAARGCTTLVIGGDLKGLTEAIVGPGAIDALETHNFTIGFWGANGVTPERGFTTPDQREAMVKRISMEHAASRYVLADASKLGLVTPATFCAFDGATLVTTPSGELRYGTYANVVEVSA